MRTDSPKSSAKRAIVHPSAQGDLRETRARQVLGVLAQLGSEHVFLRAAFRITAGVMKRMWTLVVAKTDDAAMGLHLGELFGPVSSAVHMWAWSTGNPRTALKLIAEYWKIVSAISEWEFAEQDGLIGMRYRMLHDIAPVPEDIQLRLSGLLTLLRGMTSAELKPVRAAFQLRQPVDPAEFERIFACPIVWNQTQSELWFSAAELEVAEDAASRIHAAPVNFWERRGGKRLGVEPTLVEQLEGIIEASLEHGDVGIKVAAPLVGLSERTLIRKLREEGTTYRALVERIRRDKAVELLQDRRVTLHEIAEALGYSNTQNFARAFQRWFGTSPGVGREGATTRVELH